jgi:hypothetical protein
MNFKRLLNTEFGRIIISVLLGLGIATMFRKVCKDKNCMVFSGPIISELDDKIYKYGDKCYTYNIVPDKCNTSKQIIDIKTPDNDDNEQQTNIAKILPLVGSTNFAPAPAPSSIFTMFSNI